MRTLQLKDHLTLSALNEELATAKDLLIFKQWQILNAVANNPGQNADFIATLLGSTAAIVFMYVRLYNQYGSDYLVNLQWGGRREARSLLSFEQEEQLLEKVAKKYLNGKILTAKAIRTEVELAVKRSVSDNYLWDLFKRHGWKKKAPPPKHP